MARPQDEGLAGLRRQGAIGELLFLYICATRSPRQLRPIAEELGVTVQAVSHAFRGLRRAGFAEHTAAGYRPTVRGVAWLHESFGAVRDDLEGRLARLHVIRSARAVAERPVRAGESVALRLEQGWLSARPGRDGPARGIAQRAAEAGDLVEVGQLQGIVPIPPGQLTVITIPEPATGTAAVREELAHALDGHALDLLGAAGLEAAHLAARAHPGPWVRFGVAAAAVEATRLGVNATVVLLDEELPRFIAALPGPAPPALRVIHLGERAPRARRARPTAAGAPRPSRRTSRRPRAAAAAPPRPGPR